MTTIIDRATGLAAFRQGRSLCLRLDGHLGAVTTHAIARQLRDDDHATRLRLECSGLHRVDADAIRVLASALLAWAQRRDDRSIDVLNLDLEIQAAAAWHPLRAVTDPDALVFFDPDRDPDWTL
jgi:hypothetical protein